jgi:hypothetical protein
MGANRSGDNRQKRIKRHLKNLRTQAAAAEPSATPKRKRPRAAKAQRRSAGS